MKSSIGVDRCSRLAAAYTGVDGDPRVIPLAFLLDGSRLIVCTVPRLAKVVAAL